MSTCARAVGIAAALLSLATLAGCGGSSQVNPPDTLGRIAYESAGDGTRDIWIMGGDGVAPEQVVSDAGHPSLSADGLVMAFLSGGNVFTINVDGTGQFNVTNRAPGAVGAHISEPALSPDAGLIAFVVRAVVPSPVPNISLIDADGTNERPLVANGSEPAFSPDGNTIVFMRGNDICTINTDGTGEEQLTETGVGVTLRSPSFSPAGDKILFARAAVVPDAVWSVSLFDIATKTITSVVNDATQPDFNAEGDRVVFVRDGGIYSTNLQGTDEVQLTVGPDDSDPSWE